MEGCLDDSIAFACRSSNSKPCWILQRANAELKEHARKEYLDIEDWWLYRLRTATGGSSLALSRSSTTIAMGSHYVIDHAVHARNEM